VIDVQSPNRLPPTTALSKKLHSPPSSIRRIIQPRNHSCADARQSRCTANSVGSLLHPDAPPQVTQEWEMIEFLAQMSTHTMIFLTMAVLGLAVILIVLRRVI
jgi:hypothetical protein